VDEERGIWHLANVGRVTWADLAEAAARQAGVSTRGLHRRPAAELHLAARRPRTSVLASERGQVMPRLEDALERYCLECEVSWALPSDTRAA
jgi:dTDP-4-dehydrorhamnose reductase